MLSFATPLPKPAIPSWLLDIRSIYHEPAVLACERGREILARFPDAERIEVSSHQMIPSLYGNAGTVEDWIANKRNILVLGIKKSLSARPNTRSSDFIAPSLCLSKMKNGQELAQIVPKRFTWTEATPRFTM